MPVAAMEVAVSNSFTEHLMEQGFYFHTINDPNKTVYGQLIHKSKEQAEDDADAKKSKTKPLKNASTDSQRKLSTYMKIVQSIQ